jgi:cellulose synthase/poly-beta-1,6-N-acetylglucosamine synthase-like glycosyltransferase
MGVVIVSIFFFVVFLILGILSFGPAVFIFYSMRRSSKKSWPMKVDENYKPKVSILVPTYNESSIILLKLLNLSRLKYPKDLVETIIIDSNSTDGTLEIIKQFLTTTPEANVKLLTERSRKGKSNALNHALNCCSGDVVIVSDADCFWPADILHKALPFLADPLIGGISGPKILLNSKQTWVTRMEEAYLRSANFLRVGESKSGSTVFFEGGFSAFKKDALDRFDAYETGSDDCGTVISVIEKGFKAMLVPPAEFFSPFPISFRGKIAIKSRRANQLVRVFGRYLHLILKNRIKTAKKVIVPNVVLYLFSPIAFLAFALLTFVLLVNLPYLLLASLSLMIPRVRFYVYELLESNFLLSVSVLSVLFGKRLSIWSQPDDRVWITKEALSRYHLI